MSQDLILHLKGVYFDEIQSGVKHFEYRLTTPYWKERLIGRTYRNVIFCKGYPARDDETMRLVRPYCGYDIQTLTHPHFGEEPVTVFAIRTTGESQP